jgi:hypothetical protein
MAYETELGADVRPWEQWSDWEKWKFLQEHGPEEFARLISPEGIRDVSDISITQLPVYKGSPQRLRGAYGYSPPDKASETVRRLNAEREALYQRTTGAGRDKQMPDPKWPGLPLTLDRDISFDSTDVQALGQAEADEFRTFAVKSQAERNAILDKEYDKTQRLTNLARAFGVNVSPSQRRTSTSTADPAKGMAKTAANRIFIQNLLKKVGEVGKLKDLELLKFIETQNAGPEQIKILKDMKDWVELGDMKTLYKYNTTANEIEYLYRFPSQINPELRELGWKDNIDEAYRYGRELGADKAAQDKIDRLTEIQSLITALEPSKPEGYVSGEDITWIPQTEEEYQRLKQQWGIKLPEAESLLREQLGIAEPGKASTYAYTKEDGKQAILNLTPRQYADAIRSNKYQGLVPYDIYGKELVAEQNSMLSNLAAAEMQRIVNTEIDDEMTTPLSLLQFQQHALAQWKKTGRPIGDIKRFNEQSAAAFMGEERKLEKHNSDLSVIMGQLPSYDSWEDYANKTKGMDNEAIIKGAEELERRKGDEWKYTLDRVLFNANGDTIPVNNYTEYLQAQKDGYLYKNYNDAPDRPIPIASERTWFETPDQTLDLVPVRVEIKQYDDDGNETGVKNTTIWVHNINREQEIVDTAKTTFDADIAAYEAVNEKIDKIFSNLKSNQGLTQMAAVRMLEKLQDPEGVIRESDVALMKSAMGTMWDDLERLGTVVFGRKPAFLSAQESDQVANTAMVALEVLQRNLKIRLERRKDQFLNDPYTTWTSQGKDKISFSRVMGENMFKKYTALELPEWNFKTSKFGGSEATDGTVSVNEQVLQQLLPQPKKND